MLGTEISFEFKDEAKCPASRKIFQPENRKKTQNESRRFYFEKATPPMVLRVRLSL